MKKFNLIFSLMAIVLLSSVCFTSCKDDDDDNQNDENESFIGVWKDEGWYCEDHWKEIFPGIIYDYLVINEDYTIDLYNVHPDTKEYSEECSNTYKWSKVLYGNSVSSDIIRIYVTNNNNIELYGVLNNGKLEFINNGQSVYYFFEKSYSRADSKEIYEILTTYSINGQL